MALAMRGDGLIPRRAGGWLSSRGYGHPARALSSGRAMRLSRQRRRGAENGGRRSIQPNGLWLQEQRINAFMGDKPVAFVLNFPVHPSFSLPITLTSRQEPAKRALS